jgi:predicted hotdog family 3-hydroxylacyl-ACP dehydratase
VKPIDLDIEKMIPHRSRMKLIETVLAVDDQRARTAATTSEDWPLFGDGSVDVLVTIELVAQTAALLEGWKRIQGGRGGATGWLVGIKSADFRRSRLPIAAALITEVTKSCALEGYAVFDGTVLLKDEIVAVMSVQAFRAEADA